MQPYLKLPSFQPDHYSAIHRPNEQIGGPSFRNSVMSCPGFSRLAKAWNFALAYNWGGVSSAAPSFPYRRYQLGLGGEVLESSKHTFDGRVQIGLPTSMRAIKEAQVLNPADMIALGDSVALETDLGGPFEQTIGFADLSFAQPYIPTDPAFRNTWKKRHHDRFNLVFCDGHVGTLKSKQFLDNRNEASRRRWNNDFQPHFEFSSAP